MNRPGLYRLATKFAPVGQKLHPLVQGTPLDPMRAWTKTRDFPEAPHKRSASWMRQRKEAAKMNGDREAILARIREALRDPALRAIMSRARRDHGWRTRGHDAPFREWLPPGGDSPRNAIALFAQLSEMLRTEFVVCASLARRGEASRGGLQRSTAGSASHCIPGELIEATIGRRFRPRAAVAADRRRLRQNALEALRRRAHRMRMPGRANRQRLRDRAAVRAGAP